MVCVQCRLEAVIAVIETHQGSNHTAQCSGEEQRRGQLMTGCQIVLVKKILCIDQDLVSKQVIRNKSNNFFWP